MQKPHCTAPASTNACCTRCSRVAVGQPLDRRPPRARPPAPPARGTRRRARRRAAPSTSRTRPARTRSSTRARRASRAARRAATRPPSSRPRARSPFTRSATLTRASAPARASSSRAARGGGSAAVPRTSSIGAAAAATRSGNVSASSRGAVTSTGRGEAEPNDARSSSPALSASETTAITIAFRGPTFMNVCGARRRRQPTAVISSSGASAFRFTPVTKSRDRHAPRAAHRRALDLRALDDERRQRVARRRRGREVAADRAAVADLRRADGARRLGERGQQLGQFRRHRLGVGQPGAEPQRAVVARPAAQLRRPRSG